jgi:hypothetical protein
MREDRPRLDLARLEDQRGDKRMVYAEELHASEVDKMLRKPGKVAAFRPVEHLPGNRI